MYPIYLGINVTVFPKENVSCLLAPFLMEPLTGSIYLYITYFCYERFYLVSMFHIPRDLLVTVIRAKGALYSTRPPTPPIGKIYSKMYSNIVLNIGR